MGKRENIVTWQIHLSCSSSYFLSYYSVILFKLFTNREWRQQCSFFSVQQRERVSCKHKDWKLLGDCRGKLWIFWVRFLLRFELWTVFWIYFRIMTFKEFLLVFQKKKQIGRFDPQNPYPWIHFYRESFQLPTITSKSSRI